MAPMPRLTHKSEGDKVLLQSGEEGLQHSPSALLLLPAVKNANLCIERTLQTQPLYTRALPGTSVAPILLPFPLLILSNHRRCVSSLFSSIGQLEFF